MIDPAHLRCATALAHAVEGSHLVLDTSRGDTVTVGSHPSSDMTICSLRRMIVAQTDAGTVAVCDGIDGVEVAGSVRPIGAGLYLASPGADVWFATTLVANAVVRETGIMVEAGESLLVETDIAVMPDEALGVTLVQVASDQVDPIAAAMDLCGQLLIAEIEIDPARMRP